MRVAVFRLPATVGGAPSCAADGAGRSTAAPVHHAGKSDGVAFLQEAGARGTWRLCKKVFT